jgi:hypothetical protein
MDKLFIYLHVLAAIMMGVYLMFPFLSMRITAMSGAAQVGFLNVLYATNRSGQMSLVIALLSGGYLVGKGGYSVPWMIVAVVLFLALGGLTGVLGSAMRKAISDPNGSSVAANIGKIKSISVICGVVFFAIVTIMKFPF